MKKRDVIAAALVEVGVAARTKDATAEELTDGLRKADSLAARWEADDVRIGWTYDYPADLDAVVTMPDMAVDPFICALAVTLAPMFGVAPSRDTRNTAALGYEIVKSKQLQIPTAAPAYSIGRRKQVDADANDPRTY